MYLMVDDRLSASDVQEPEVKGDEEKPPPPPPPTPVAGARRRARARAVRSSARLSGGGGGAAARRSAEAAAAAAGEAERGAAREAARRRAQAVERAREVEDSPRVLRDKCRRLARALRNARHLVVYTGAGISTAADIPDYRGPHGVWTRLQRGEPVGRVEVARARPTYTHMALTALWARGALKFVVSQNCDGLHVRAGLPRRALAELHGDMFAERCAAPGCRRVYLRAFDTTERTARHAHGTRRLCHACGSELQDSIVHFGERGRAAWPLNWAGALRHAAAADVVLCLGSSLKVLRRYPRLWRMRLPPAQRPALYIVNLQWTPKDAAAALKINARCDAVMAQLARRLRLRVPRYRPRADPLRAHAVPLAPPERHTTRRPLARDLISPASSSVTSSSSCSSRSPSPSASDSDEEVPLRRLAERLRAPPRPPPPDLLHAFQVRLHAGEASILLRAQHAPAVLPAPAPTAAPRRAVSELRRVRIARRTLAAPALTTLPALNGLAATAPCDTLKKEDIKIKLEDIEIVKDNVKVIKEDVKVEIKEEVKHEERTGGGNGALAAGARLQRLLRGAGAGEASALAAAIMARAVLLCRASLYPGLHTIIAPPAAPSPPIMPAPATLAASAPHAAPVSPAAPAAECAWCARRYSVRRCLWYGPPPAPGAPLEARAWRRVRGRRYLCACCGGAESPPPAATGELDDAGWYGKGYRKGRRRRR